MIELIENIANLSTGIYAKRQTVGEVYYIQGRDFDKSYALKNTIEPSVLWDANIPKHLLKKGDVLIASKGFDHFAAVFNNEVSFAVASSIFIVLRDIDKDKLLPEFLAWYLNHPNTQLILRNSAKGTNLPSISKKTIGELKVDIPALEIQNSIVRIDELRSKEKQLTSKIENLKDLYINKQLINTLIN